MTRIIAGVARGRVLQVPDRGTRPSADRLREALFSSLESLLEFTGARVLDLFAGTGAVGLEALSRGAAEVTLVESSRAAALVLRRNCDVVGLPGAHVQVQSVESFVAAPAGDGGFDAGYDAGAGYVDAGYVDAGYDLAFADPPYDYDDAALGNVLADLSDRWLAPGAIVVVERSARSETPPWPLMIQPVKNKRYGDSVLWYGRREQQARTCT